MALDNINKVKTDTVVTPTPQQKDAGTTSVKSNQPINFKSQKNEITTEQSQIVDFINSPEFKKLPKAEQLKQLKAKFPFMKDYSPEEITSYVSVAKQTVENSTKEKTPAPVETKNQDEYDKLLLEYKQKNNIEGESYEVIADIQAKETTGQKLTASEKRLLNLHNQQEQDSKESLKLVVSLETLTSKKFRNSSTEDKLKIVTTAFLKNDKTYQSLSEKDKEAYLAEKINDVTNLVIDDTDKSQNKEKKAEIKALALIQAAYEEGKSIDDLKKLSNTERNQIISRTENKVIKNIIQLVNKNHPKTTSYSQKVKAYADTILSMTDPDYQNIKDQKEKQEYCNKKIDEFIIEKLNISEWENASPQQKRNILQRAALTFEYVVNTTGEDSNIVENLKNFEKKSDLDKNNATLEYLKQVTPQTREIRNLTRKIEDEKIVYDRLLKQGITNPSTKEFINEILKMENEGNSLPHTLKIYKEQYLRSLDIKHKDFDPKKRSIEDKAALSGQDVNTYIKDGINSDNYKLIVEECALSGDEDVIETCYQALIYDKHLSPAEAQFTLSSMFKENPEYIKDLYCKVKNGDEFNKITDLSVDTQEGVEIAALANKNASKWFKNDKNEIAKIGIHTLSLDSSKVDSSAVNTIQKAYTVGLHDNLSKEENKSVFNIISSSNTVPPASMANFTKTFIETAHNDSDRVYYSKSFSSINNPAVTEGLAAGAQYVSDPVAKQQYTNYVETAANNYPPETQAAIKSALQTGEITPQTLAKTTVSNKPQQQTNNNPETNNTNRENIKQTSSNQSAVSAKATDSKSNNNILENSNRNITSKTNNIATTPIYNNTASKTNSNSIGSKNTTEKTTSTTNISDNKVKADYKVSEEKANLQLKETTFENIAEVKEKIDNSIKEWEQKQAAKLTEEDIETIKTLAAEEAIDEYMDKHPNEREIIIDNLSKAKSINEVYNILVSALGSKVHDKFIEVLASYGSANNIRSFVNSKANDTDVIKKMYLRCNSEGLKSELLNLLPESTIREMLEKGDITTLDAVNHKILYSFMLKNLYTMTSTSFANFLKYLPFDERKNLTELRNQSLNIEPQNLVKNSTPSLNENNPLAQTQQAQQNNTVNKQSIENTQPNYDVNKPEPMFMQGETVKTLANGTTITNQGTTFAGISNNTYDDDFRVVNTATDKKEGSPIGMSDEILTPGSEEWKRKYNKQQEIPTTAFTMAAMSEEDDEFGMPFGSTKVGMGQKIKKKYPPQSFRFNA